LLKTLSNPLLHYATIPSGAQALPPGGQSERSL
jgi:hypothetical protein